MNARRSFACGVVVLTLACGLVWAVDPPEPLPVGPPTDIMKMYQGDHEIRHFESRIGPEEPGPIELPRPIDVEPILSYAMPGGGALSKLEGSVPGTQFGGALMGPRGGGAIGSPRARADKEIKSLIRLLD